MNEYSHIIDPNSRKKDNFTLTSPHHFTKGGISTYKTSLIPTVY